VVESAIALAIMAVISTALGWVVAGRVLRPLRTMTAATQAISAANLNERLAMPGPRDELRQLADTIDGLLGRLEGAFEAQRRFVANASHELRTPLTAVRAMLEMAITDPRATVESFRTTCRHALEEGERQEELIDALLALAQGQRGLDRREPVDLVATVEQVVASHRADALARGIDVDTETEPARVSGDRRLIERLVTNLLENALLHNVAQGGQVSVRVEATGGGPTVTISNSGPLVPSEDVQRILQPFQRLERDRVGHRGGLGLGLSIVAAIADAHHAALAVSPNPGGGLTIAVRFPAHATPDGEPQAAGQPEPALSAD
jgi:signal transduction histidine kinase